ncbi:hypothetical protein QBC35DRAFT_383151 [Podospora australis]|uniref:DUF676 domain-containing protein n=1 Tax=Podospora australis TaxID=1536484 RepID=A0AAN7AGW7_9PEZI|nr:hypothetical protein QBC35DRAFT_383151 [Podospora australis]
MPSASPSSPASPAFEHSTTLVQLDGANKSKSKDWSSGDVLALRNMRDPRRSSTHSLLPSVSSDEEGPNTRRTLLVVYIHGFMGNDSSFRSFPAHVHQFLKQRLAETHVIHTKIYPRYKTYKSIEVACDNFSKWLAPHESPTTDVVLVGHSMGGLLAADIALLDAPPDGGPPFRHRILGTVSMDAPLLGLHPGIVVAGIASLFRPAPSPPPFDGRSGPPTPSLETTGSISPDASIYNEVRPPSGAASPTPRPSLSSPSPSAWDTSTPDPTYNPAFFNDVAFIDRGWLKNIAHFASKHKQENLFEAAANHIVSHLEFGGCLADYSGLKSRYNRLRRLEDVDDLSNAGLGDAPTRVRFVNYYTVSTGIPKKPKEPKPSEAFLLKPGDASRDTARTSLEVPSGVSTPRISIEDHSDDGQRGSLQLLEPMPIEEEDDEEEQATPRESTSSVPKDIRQSDDTTTTNITTDNNTLPGTDADLLSDLPPIPDLPPPPAPPDFNSFSDKDSKKLAEKEHKRALKIHEQAVKSREKAIKDREKLLKERQKALEKLRKTQQKEQEKQSKLQQKDGKKEAKQQKMKKDKKKLEKLEKKQKLGKFCMLPTNGKQDPTWVKVFMQDVDEVGAHCGLFVDSAPHYEQLVGDVGCKIAGWVEEDVSRRVVIEGTWGLD